MIDRKPYPVLFSLCFLFLFSSMTFAFAQQPSDQLKSYILPAISHLLPDEHMDFTVFDKDQQHSFFHFRIDQPMDLIRFRERLAPVDNQSFCEVLKKKCVSWKGEDHLEEQVKMGMIYTGKMTINQQQALVALDRQGNVFCYVENL